MWGCIVRTLLYSANHGSNKSPEKRYCFEPSQIPGKCFLFVHKLTPLTRLASFFFCFGFGGGAAFSFLEGGLEALEGAAFLPAFFFLGLSSSE